MVSGLPGEHPELLARHVADQQQGAERNDHGCGADLDRSHCEYAESGPHARETARELPRADRGALWRSSSRNRCVGLRLDGLDLRRAGGLLPFAVRLHQSEQAGWSGDVEPVWHLVCLRRLPCRRAGPRQGRDLLLSRRQRRDLAPWCCSVLCVGGHSIPRCHHCRSAPRADAASMAQRAATATSPADIRTRDLVMGTSPGSCWQRSRHRCWRDRAARHRVD